MGMAETAPNSRWFRPTPAWLVLLLLATTGILFLSEQMKNQIHAAILPRQTALV
jgi:hypothetical protein